MADIENMTMDDFRAMTPEQMEAFGRSLEEGGEAPQGEQQPAAQTQEQEAKEAPQQEAAEAPAEQAAEQGESTDLDQQV